MSADSKISQEFFKQLVVDLSIDTLQKISLSPINFLQDYEILKDKLDDISLEIQSLQFPEEDKSYYQVLTEQLDSIREIISFYAAMDNGAESADITNKLEKDIEQLHHYLWQQPGISGLSNSGEIDILTTDRSIELDGEWKLIDTVQGGDFDGLEIGFRLHIKKNHMTFEAAGEKAWENGLETPEKYRTPLMVYGYIKNNVIRAAFVEEGVRRESTGEFVWLALSRELLSGVFVSDTGARGASLLHKVHPLNEKQRELRRVINLED